ncbi:MAG: hypothetical protein AB7G44_00995 [Bacteroidia bacterium]
MFVESMTFEEIRQEFEKDKYFLIRKIAEHSKQVLKLMRKTNMRTYNKYFEYISPRKNHWYYCFKASPDKAKGKMFVEQYCCFYTYRSYAIINYSLEADKLFYYTSHFFTRYFEREGLDTQDPHKVIKLFIDSNPLVASQPLADVGNGVWTLFAQMSTGVGLGYMHRKIKLEEFRTFISNDMLKGTQVELSKQLEERFKLHIVRNSPADGIANPNQH